MARKRTLGAPHREVVWLSRAPRARYGSDEAGCHATGEVAQSEGDGPTFPDDADCPASYSYPVEVVDAVAETATAQPTAHRRALVLNLLGFRVVLVRNPAPHAA